MGSSAAAIAEVRAAVRREAALVPNITSVSLMPQRADAELVNISTTGMLVECATRRPPGSSCTVVIEGGFTPASIECRVARSAVVAVRKDGSIRYHIGFCFKQPIALEELPAPPEPVVEAPIAEPTKPVQAPSTLRNRW
jgi:hypothetical protein